MSAQICLLSEQKGALVGHVSFQEEKIFCSPDGYVWDSLELSIQLRLQPLNLQHQEKQQPH